MTTPLFIQKSVILDHFPVHIKLKEEALQYGRQCTPPTPSTFCSKRKYTLCFPVSTQSVAGAGPPAVLRDSQLEIPNNQATVCEEMNNNIHFHRF